MFYRNKGLIALTCFYLLTISLRAFQNFNSQLIPGLNGGYYAVQVRSLMESGRLAYPDYPLVFYIESAIAWIFSATKILSLNNAILVSAKLIDSILPPLVMFPLYFLGKKRSSHTQDDLLLSCVVGLTGLFIFPLLGLSSEFTKNATAFTFVALTIFSSFYLPKFLLPSLLISIFSHKVGAALGVGVTAISIISKWPILKKLSHKLIATVLTALIIITLTYTYTSEKSVFYYLLSRYPIISYENQFGLLGINIILILLITALWKSHKAIKESEFLSISIYTSLAIVLSSIFLGKTYAERFWFISLFPLVVAIVLAFKYLSNWDKKALAFTAFLLEMVSIGLFLNSYKLPTIKQEAFNEILSQRILLQNQENSVIIADHGIDWWIAWITHAKVAQKEILDNSELKKLSLVQFMVYKPHQKFYDRLSRGDVPQNATKSYSGKYIEIYDCNQNCF